MKRILFFIVVFIAGFEVTYSQVSLTNAAPTATINFSSSMQATVGSGPFTGDGFSPTPVAGRLNSNAWETTGWVDGNLAFGGAMTNPAHGRGAVAGGVITEGIYAYTDNPGSAANPALMIQPGDVNFAPGSITLKIKNNGTSNMTQLEVSYNLFVRNDEPRSNSFNFSHSPDNVTFEQEPLLNYVSPDVADTFQWVAVDVNPSRNIFINGINIAPGAFYYIRWTCEDVSGTGARDEFGLDDIILTASYGAPAPEITVKANGLTILAGDMTPQTGDFTRLPDAFTGGSSVSVTYEIINLGGAPLTISGVTITGSTDFSFNPAPPVGTVPGVSGGAASFLPLKITFAPTSAGLKSAIISIANNDSNENPYTFKIESTGINAVPDISVSGATSPNNGPIFTGDNFAQTSNSTLFPGQIVGSPGVTQIFSIKNTGVSPSKLILTGPAPYITITGANPGDFTLVTSPSSPNIFGNFTKTFSIKFAPTASGIRTAVVTILNNDPYVDIAGNDESVYTFLIQGNGIAPEMDLFGNTQPIASGSVVPSFSNYTFFDYVNVATGTIDRVFTIQNNGSAPLTVGTVSISGSSDFTVLTNPAASVAIAGATTFSIRFDPSSPGLKTATVSIVNNDFNENPYTFAISGYGVDYVPCALGIPEKIQEKNFEPPVDWTLVITGSAAPAGGIGYAVSGDNGTTPKFLGTKGLQSTGNTSILKFAAANTSDYKNVDLTFKLGSFANGVSEGSDVDDKVVIAVSSDGVTWSDELVITGNNNAKWAFSAAGVAASIYDGDNTPATFSPPTGGFLNSQGYANILLSGLPQVSGLLIRITLVNNNINEIWAIDNILLSGRKESFSTWNGSTWIGGTPTSSIKAIIDGNYNTSSGNLQACKCEIKPTRIVTIQSGAFFNIQSDFRNDGIITIEDGGSLVQKNDFAVNGGILNVKRYTTPMSRYDYTYWSSPVQSQTLFNLTPLTLSDKFFQYDSPNFGWQNIPGSTIMLPGKGYIARAPQTFDVVTMAPYLNGVFTGITNNGIIQADIYTGAWNLLGNPYPSAIDANAFVTNVDNVGKVAGTLYFWTHNSPLANYVYDNDDYAAYNATGGMGTKAPNLGVNNSIPNGSIASGQGFMVRGTATGKATFTNAMRRTTGNTQFFRLANPVTAATENPTIIEKSRIWLDISNEQGAFKQTLIGYVDGATNDYDNAFDGELLGGNTISIYSILGDQLLSIQGRAVPFNTTDKVPLGYKSEIDGGFTISIEATDGVFVDQEIYLEDKLLNIVYDLKAAPYNFQTVAGTFDDRFELRYSSNTLAVPDYTSVGNLLVAVDHNNINVRSDIADIATITVYDLLGRVILNATNVNNLSHTFENVQVGNQALIVAVKLSNGKTINKKIIL